MESLLQAVVALWDARVSEEDTIVSLGDIQLEDTGVVSEVHNDNEWSDDATIFVDIAPIKYSLIDGRAGVTQFVMLRTNPREPSWAEVRVGDAVHFIAEIRNSDQYGSPIVWRGAVPTDGIISIATTDAKCVRIVERANDRTTESPLIPYTGEKIPEIVDGPSHELHVETDSQVPSRIISFWERTLGLLSNESSAHLVEVWLRFDYSMVQSFERDTTARRTKLRKLVDVNLRPMNRGFLRIDYTIDQYHHEWLTRLAEGLSFSPVSDRLAEFGSSLTIVAAVTDDFDKREFIQL